MSLLRLISGILFIVGAIVVLLAGDGSIKQWEFWFSLGFAAWVLAGGTFDQRIG